MRTGRVLTWGRSTDGFCHGFATVGGVLGRFGQAGRYRKLRKWFKIKKAANVGA
jgi:hypothetical protein